MSGPSPPGSRLGQRILRGTLHLSAAAWFTYGLNFVINLAIARLLGPGDFGIYAFVLAINELLVIIAALSIPSALINLEDDSPELYATASAMAWGLAALSFVTSLILAAIVSAARSGQEGTFLVALGAARAMQLLASVPRARLERALRYGAVAVIGVVAGNVPNLLALWFATIGMGPLSLVLRDVFNALLTLGLTAAWARHRFSFHGTREDMRKIMGFARPMFFARACDIAVERVDRLVVGSVFGSTPLGLYHQARYLATAGHLAARPLFQLAFNLYSRVKADPRRLERSFGIVNYFLLRFSAAAGTPFLVFPEATVRLLLGSEWISAAPLLRLMSVYAIALPVFANLTQLLFARGEALKNVRIRFVEAAVFLPGLLLASLYDSVLGVAWALTVRSIIAVALSSYYSAHVVRSELTRGLLAPAVVMLATFAVFQAPPVADTIGSLPWPTLPFLPPVVFSALLALVEQRRLLGELTYLRLQLRGGMSD